MNQNVRHLFLKLIYLVFLFFFPNQFLQVCLLFVAVISSTLAADGQTTNIGKRVKRSFWPFNADSATDDSETDNESEPEAVAAVSADVPQQIVLPQDIRLPAHLYSQLNGIPYAAPSQAAIINHQGNLHYPIYRVHKFNGIHLNPLPVSLVGHYPSEGQINVIDHRAVAAGGGDGIGGAAIGAAPSGMTAEKDEATDGDEEDEEEEEKEEDKDEDNLVEPEEDSDNNNDNDNEENAEGAKPSKGSTGAPLKVTPDLLKLAKKLGIKDLSKFNRKSLDEAANLLGTTSQEETIQTIMELAETEDGLNLIKQYLNNSDQDGAASELDSEYIDPEAYEYAQPSNAVEVNAGDPLRSLDAKLDRTRVSLGILKPFVPTASPNLFGRIAQWTSFLNPFAGREEVPIPSIGEADANELAANPDIIVHQDAIPVPELPELSPLPSIGDIDTHTIQEPALPQIYIPGAYSLPAGYASAGGPYIRVKLPLTAFNPVPQIPIPARYLNHYQQQLALRSAQLPAAHSVVAFQAPQPAAVNVAEGVNAAGQTVSVASQVASPVIPLNSAPSAAPAAALADNLAAPPAAVHVPRPIVSVAAPHTSVHVSRPIGPSAGHSVSINAPHTAVHVSRPHGPSAGHSVSIQAPFASIDVSHPAPRHRLPSVNVRTPFATVNVARPVEPTVSAIAVEPAVAARPVEATIANHVGHLPLTDSNYEVFRNAPRIVTSYGTPALPYTFPDEKPALTWSSPSASLIHDLGSAASDIHEHVLSGSDLIAGEAASAAEATPEDQHRSEDLAAALSPSAAEESIPMTLTDDAAIVAAISDNTARSTAELAVSADKATEADRAASIPDDSARGSLALAGSAAPAAADAGAATDGDQSATDTLDSSRTEADAIVAAENPGYAPAAAAASPIDRRSQFKSVIQRRSSSQTNADNNNIQRIAKPQRMSGFEAYATGKVHTADPEVVNMLPLTMRQAIQRQRAMQ